MDKLKITPEYWILIALINASERYGINLTKWYLSKRPDDFDISWDQFSKTVEKMETEGSLKRASDGVNHCLSDNGIKEAIKLKRKLKFNDYYFIISKFPEIELKEKVETLEAFIVAAFFLIISFIGLKSPITEFGNSVYVIVALIYIIILISSSIQLSTSFAGIMFFWIVNLKRNTLWIFKEWLWNNKSKFMFPIPAIIVIFMLYGVYLMNIVSWQIMVWGLVLLLIGQLISNYQKIVLTISNLFNKK